MPSNILVEDQEAAGSGSFLSFAQKSHFFKEFVVDFFIFLSIVGLLADNFVVVASGSSKVQLLV